MVCDFLVLHGLCAFAKGNICFAVDCS